MRDYPTRAFRFAERETRGVEGFEYRSARKLSKQKKIRNTMKINFLALGARAADRLLGVGEEGAAEARVTTDSFSLIQEYETLVLIVSW